MSNWFSSHPTYTILGHTLLVATVTWGISNFVIDENKVNLYKAQIENERTVNRQLEAKISVLEQRQTALSDENKQLREWLSADESSFPALRKKITLLEQQLTASADFKNSKEGKAGQTQSGPYKYIEELVKGQAFVDPLTNATLGVSDIGSDRTAKIYLFLPGKGEERLEDARPGSSWTFNYHQRNFKLTLTKIEWIGNQFSASVVELK